MQKPNLIYLDTINLRMRQSLKSEGCIREPKELLEALQIARASSFWFDSTSTYKENIVHWIRKARRKATRAKRIDAVVDHCVRGEMLFEQ